jgi:hypothetical protein
VITEPFALVALTAFLATRLTSVKDTPKEPVTVTPPLAVVRLVRLAGPTPLPIDTAPVDELKEIPVLPLTVAFVNVTPVRPVMLTDPFVLVSVVAALPMLKAPLVELSAIPKLLVMIACPTVTLDRR